MSDFNDPEARLRRQIERCVERRHEQLMGDFDDIQRDHFLNDYDMLLAVKSAAPEHIDSYQDWVTQ